MNKLRFIVLVVVLLVMNFLHPTPSYGQATPNPNPITIRGFHLVSPTEGWVFIDHLYWTKDVGKTWTDITPPNLNGSYGSPAVAFADNQHGSVILATLDQNPAGNGVNYSMLQTTDGGKTWSTKPLSVSPADALAFYYPGKISLQFIDADIGWLSIRHEGGDSDSGLLFKTVDGGTTWSELNLPINSYFKYPIGDPVYFVTEQLGWIATDPQITSNILYRTQDGGQTWQTQTVGVVPFGTSARIYELPQFVNAKEGLLIIGYTINNKGFEEVYLTHDGGVTWQLDSTLAGSGPVKLLDSTHWIGMSFGKGEVQRTITQVATPTILNPDSMVTNIVNMDFVSASAGLALSEYQICPPNPQPGQCVEQRQLLYTSDGGQTWQLLVLP